MSAPHIVALLGERGQVMLYHHGDNNHCPSCGGTQWFVGRVVATCAYCDAPIPLATPAEQPALPEKEAA